MTPTCLRLRKITGFRFWRLAPTSSRRSPPRADSSHCHARREEGPPAVRGNEVTLVLGPSAHRPISRDESSTHLTGGVSERRLEASPKARLRSKSSRFRAWHGYGAGQGARIIFRE